MTAAPVLLPSPAERPGTRTAEGWLALLASALLGTRFSVYAGITLGTLAAVVLAPMWLGRLWQGRLRIAFLVLGVLTLAWGFVLRDISAIDHYVDTRQSIADTAVLLQLVVGVGVLLWSSDVAGLRRTGLCFGAGIVVQGVVGGQYATDNPWKTFFAVPAAIIVLSLLSDPRHGGRDVVALVLLAAGSAAFDSRSYAATFAVGALLRLWQLRPRTLTRRGSATLTIGLFAALGGGVYWLGQSLLVGGYLGSAAQARSIQQINETGSLLLGGRPELSATIAMMRDHIFGHGVGVSPRFHDVMVAKDAMSAIGYDPNNGYVERFMFGNGIELHSVLGDLWARWGIAGLILFVLLTLVIVERLTRRVLDRTASGVVLFLSCWSLWNMLFSPLYSALPTLMLTLAVLLPASSHDAAHTGGDDEADALDAAADDGPQRAGRVQ